MTLKCARGSVHPEVRSLRLYTSSSKYYLPRDRRGLVKSGVSGPLTRTHASVHTTPVACKASAGAGDDYLMSDPRFGLDDYRMCKLFAPLKALHGGILAGKEDAPGHQ